MWKDIEGYEWIYQVSYSWDVKILNYRNTWTERLFKYWKHPDWHYRVTLSKCGIHKTFIISRLVAIAFIPNPDNLPCVCHIKEDLIDWKLYDWADNLFWGTYKDNTKDMFKKWRDNNNLKYNNPNKWKFWKDNWYSKSVNQYSLYGEFIKEWWSMMDIKRELWIHNSTISKCCRWNRKTSGWFIWKFNL
jgi:hypothetical protein